MTVRWLMDNKQMTNLAKLSQIDTMAEMVYDTEIYDKEYCHDCQCEDGKIKKGDCLRCIKEWLEKEVEE